MIHINKSKDKKYYVTVVAENGEILSTSETLNSKRNAWKNVEAQAKAFNPINEDELDKWYHVLVTDNTGKKPVKIEYEYHLKMKEELV